MFWVLSIFILVAVFNILSSLIMLVRAKTKDIAILRTMGASRIAMMRIFMTVGTLIGALIGQLRRQDIVCEPGSRRHERINANQQFKRAECFHALALIR